MPRRSPWWLQCHAPGLVLSLYTRTRSSNQKSLCFVCFIVVVALLVKKKAAGRSATRLSASQQKLQERTQHHDSDRIDSNLALQILLEAPQVRRGHRVQVLSLVPLPMVYLLACKDNTCIKVSFIICTLLTKHRPFSTTRFIFTTSWYSSNYYIHTTYLFYYYTH